MLFRSTTMNILTGCLAATSGSVKVDGHDIFEDPIEAKKHIGYLPEQPPVYGEMTPREYLSFVAEAKGVPYEKSLRHIKEVMQLTQIYDVRDRLIRNLSKGYRQRVGIAQAMIGEPDVIILDEPTVGLDPAQIIEIRNLIKKLGRIKTVIISSHILAEISAVCDHVIIISKGNIVANDTLANLEARAGGNSLKLKIKGDCKRAEKIISAINGVESAEYTDLDGIVEVAVTFSCDVREAIFNAFSEAKMPILEMHTDESTLEDIFLQLAYGSEDKSIAVVGDYDDKDYDDDDGYLDEDEKDEEEEKDDDYKPLFSSSDDEEDDR